MMGANTRPMRSAHATAWLLSAIRSCLISISTLANPREVAISSIVSPAKAPSYGSLSPTSSARRSGSAISASISGFGIRPSRSHRSADLPGTRERAHDGRERMDRDERRRLAGRHHRIDRRRDLLPIRRPESRATAGDLGGVDVGVARHDRAVGVAHDQRRIIQAPVRIDEQTANRSTARRARRACAARARVTSAAPMS